MCTLTKRIVSKRVFNGLCNLKYFTVLYIFDIFWNWNDTCWHSVRTDPSTHITGKTLLKKYWKLQWTILYAQNRNEGLTFSGLTNCFFSDEKYKMFCFFRILWAKKRLVYSISESIDSVNFWLWYESDWTLRDGEELILCTMTFYLCS